MQVTCKPVIHKTSKLLCVYVVELIHITIQNYIFYNVLSHDFHIIICVLVFLIKTTAIHWTSNHNKPILCIYTSHKIPPLYAVKVQRSLAPLSRFRGSHIPSAHEQQCCRFQSYANSVRSPMKFTSEIDIAWTTFLGSTTTDHVITSCDVGL